MQKIAYVLFALTCATPVQAAIYKYVDAEGNITFTDRPRPGAVKLVDTPDSTVTSVKTPRRSSSEPRQPSPTNFPKVDKQTQSRRDDVRRTLLEEERRSETNALAAVRAALADSKRSAGEHARLTDSQRLHEKNIEMLDKELARLK